MTAPRTQSVPALERGLRILECLSQSNHGLTLSQITRALDLPKSTAHCLLLTFERSGYIERDQMHGRYRIGLRLFGLANVALPALAMREQGAPVLRHLMEQTRLTVHMAALDHEQLVLIAKFSPPGLPSPATWIGKRMELHCTAIGKVLLAYTVESEVERLIRKQGMLRHNENTINSLRGFRQELELVRHRGYAIDDEEEEIGTRCIGAPVLGVDGHPTAAISLVGTVTDIAEESVSRLAAAVKDAAAAIAERLSSRAPALSEAVTAAGAAP